MFYNVDIKKFNYIETESTCYFLRKINKNQICFLNSSCPHRGGPLHLGIFDKTRDLVICPWHNKKTSIKSLVKKAPPYIRKGNMIKIYLLIKNNKINIRYKKSMNYEK